MLDKLKKLNFASVYTMISRFIIVPGILIVLLVVLTTDRIDWGWGYVLIGFILISEHIIAAWVVPKRAGDGSGGGRSSLGAWL